MMRRQPPQRSVVACVSLPNTHRPNFNAQRAPEAETHQFRRRSTHKPQLRQCKLSKALFMNHFCAGRKP
jgi:hypothetical protein